MDSSAGRAANDDGRRGIPEIVALGDEIGELVEAAGDEIDELHFGDGAQAKIAHAAGSADDGAFADGRIDDALPAEFFEQTFAGLERAAIDADIFADENHAGVGGHFFEHGLLDGFEKGDGSHGYFRAFPRAEDFAEDFLTAAVLALV